MWPRQEKCFLCLFFKPQGKCIQQIHLYLHGAARELCTQPQGKRQITTAAEAETPAAAQSTPAQAAAAQMPNQRNLANANANLNAMASVNTKHESQVSTSAKGTPHTHRLSQVKPPPPFLRQHTLLPAFIHR